jgi:hypothetical protein
MGRDQVETLPGVFPDPGGTPETRQNLYRVSFYSCASPITSRLLAASDIHWITSIFVGQPPMLGQGPLPDIDLKRLIFSRPRKKWGAGVDLGKS